ncbi:MAG: hypothetical protein IJW40_07640 [Clostridia bacterium]|nr:hypothetical protein [Clostridia bacterium]
MKLRKIILPLFTAFLLCITSFLLISCGDRNLLPMTGEDGSFSYQVIRPDISSETILDASVDIKNALRDHYEIEPIIGTDWIHPSTGVADFPEIPTEVLVGLTNRAESQQVYEELADHEYTVRIVNQKIVILGKSDFGTKLATAYFIENYMSGDRAGEIPQDLHYVKEVDYMYTYSLSGSGAEKYDYSVTVATLQGLYNRKAEHKLYITTGEIESSSKALSILSSDDRYLSEVERVKIANRDELFALTGDCIETVVIWDTAVPATVNVATTIAGVENGIVMTYEQYEKTKASLPDTVKTVDLRNKFDGSETGSAKNDAYRWAIREYLETGRCTTAYMCSFEDAYYARERGGIRYTVCRDAAVYYGAFVFDLSVWADEVPKDDRTQRMGLDLETYELILSTMQKVRGNDSLTEIMGFFPSEKYCLNGNDETWESKYYGTQFEWDAARIFTPYGCYWNPVTEYACNVTFHNAYELATPLQQNRPTEQITLDRDENKVYLLLCMGDYDSTGSLYTKMLLNWNNEERGTIPLAWSFNPNLIKHYPDIVEYFYETATENDYFVSNVGAAGWYTPSRVPSDQWEVVAAHHTKYFEMTDISVAPDIWDYQTLSPMAEKYITSFATTGAGTLVSNQLNRGTGTPTTPHKAENGSVIDALCNSFDRNDAVKCAEGWVKEIQKRDRDGNATFMSVRCVWCTPAHINDCIEELEKQMPNRDIEVVDPFTYYRLLGESMEK